MTMTQAHTSADTRQLQAKETPLLLDVQGLSVSFATDRGRVKAIAVASDKRAPGFPDTPTAAEGGVPTYQVATWYGLWAPKGTPREAIEAMQAEMKKALGSDELKASWAGLGANPPNLYGPDFGKFVGSEIKRWHEVVKSSGGKLD